LSVCGKNLAEEKGSNYRAFLPKPTNWRVSHQTEQEKKQNKNKYMTICTKLLACAAAASPSASAVAPVRGDRSRGESLASPLSNPRAP
jgi:uncharacterized membrane-anchored protein